MLKTSRDPYGYKNLLAYKKAEELQARCSELTHLFPKLKTLGRSNGPVSPVGQAKYRGGMEKKFHQRILRIFGLRHRRERGAGGGLRGYMERNISGTNGHKGSNG